VGDDREADLRLLLLVADGHEDALEPLAGERLASQISGVPGNSVSMTSDGALRTSAT